VGGRFNPDFSVVCYRFELDSPHPIAYITLDGVCGQLHAPSALPYGKTARGAHWTRAWIGHRAGLTTDEKRENSRACQESKPDLIVVQPIAYYYID
jgi:hypothetical protein